MGGVFLVEVVAGLKRACFGKVVSEREVLSFDFSVNGEDIVCYLDVVAFIKGEVISDFDV